MTAAAPKTNRIGLTLADYKGSPSTLCDGCGHDAITSQIIKSFFELGTQPQGYGDTHHKHHEGQGGGQPRQGYSSVYEGFINPLDHAHQPNIFVC